MDAKGIGGVGDLGRAWTRARQLVDMIMSESLGVSKDVERNRAKRKDVDNILSILSRFKGRPCIPMC